MLSQLFVEAAVQNLDEHGEVLEGSWAVASEAENVERRPDTFLENRVG